MKSNAQQVRTQLLTLIIAGVASAGFATAATAAGMGGGIQARVGVDATAGGAADAHMSGSGSANSNAQWQSGSARGADRAAERMNANGTDMKQSAGMDLEAAGSAAATGKR